jgi:ferric-dicitrate binding protein FerR (iron transport regulator)
VYAGLQMNYLPRIVDPQFMIRVLRHAVTPEEQEFFNLWLEESDAHKEEFATTSLLWDRMLDAPIPHPPGNDRLWQGIQARIRLAEEGARTRHGSFAPQTRAPFRYSLSYPLAALLLIVAASVLLLSWPKRDLPVQPEPMAGQIFREVVTAKGERLTVPLMDGSLVFLNAGSTLRFPESFEVGAREVELEGEAFFAVRGDPSRTFRVSTEVKGTEFNVRYRGDQVEIVVAKGAVRVVDRKGSAQVDLGRGEGSVYRDSTGFSRPRKVDLRRAIAWREGRLSFQRTRLADAMKEIELCYDVRVVFKNRNAPGRSLTGYFASDSLDEVLSTIALAMDVRIERNGQTVVVY